MSKQSTEKINIKSPAKINLHLEVIGKREDGFHELAMIMQNIDLADSLEFEINHNGLIRLMSDCNDLSLSSDNLIIKSANLLKEKLNLDFGADILLTKNIPIGAGLAGGSSNAAATLIGLNKLWNLNLTCNEILILSESLGSDVPFFIKGGSQLCFGRGEVLEEINSYVDHGVLLLKNPNIAISTAETYKKYSIEFNNKFDMSAQYIDNIRNNLRKKSLNFFGIGEKPIRIKNDLQLIVENHNNSVKKALFLLSKLTNCLSYSMSGSGPTCFGIFKDVDDARKALRDNYENFKNEGFDSWACKFVNKGISLL